MADLTTLTAVKQYLGLTSPNQDALISKLITRESNVVQRYLGRVFPFVARVMRLDGTGSDRQMLPDVPIVAVNSLTIDNIVVAASDGVIPGYLNTDNMLYLIGGSKFTYRKQNVAVSWTAGWKGSETDFAAASVAPTTGNGLDGTSGTPNVDLGVVYASSGTALAKVGSNAAVGQYSFNAGVYSFAAGDTANQVTMSYYYVPSDVEEACIEMVGLDLKQRDNLGIASKTLAQETITYQDTGLTKSVIQMLSSYERKVPL